MPDNKTETEFGKKTAEVSGLPEPDEGRLGSGPVTLLIGDFDRAELRQIGLFFDSGQIDRQAYRIGVRADETLANLKCQLPAATVDEILIAPAFRDQFREDHLQLLSSRYPSAEIRAVVGSCLEGETRSGAAWDGVPRLYVNQVIPRWMSKAAKPSPRFATSTMTADDEKVLAWTSTVAITPTPSSSQSGQTKDQRSLVAVCSELGAMRDVISEMIEEAGLLAIRCSPDSIFGSTAVCAVVYDAVAQHDRQKRHLRRLSSAFPDASITVLASFPRWQEVNAWQDAGATMFLGKPFENQDLLNCISSATTSDREKPEAAAHRRSA